MHIDEYRKLAEVEDDMWYFHNLNQRILLPLKDWKGHSAEVLDAGCGTGGLIKALHSFEPLWNVSGLDYSPLACTLARERTQAEIVEGSITELPFKDKTFDIVVCADVISQVKDPSIAIQEFARVLKPNGVLVLNVAAYQWMWSYHDTTCETQHRFRRSQLRTLIEENGLKPMISSYANMILFPLIITRRKIFPPKMATSDVKSYSPLIDSIFSAIGILENSWLRIGGTFPTGCSVYLAATKR